MNQRDHSSARKVLFVQLPIPPAGPSPIHGNVPLAAGYLILHARSRGLDQHFQFEILPPKISNYRSDVGIVEEILSREPGIVGFSCYLWNIDRTLWIASHVTAMQSVISQVLRDCPHSSMQVILEPMGDPTQVTTDCVEQLLATCYQHPNYLDRYYSLNPQGLLGSKRVLVVVDDEAKDDLDPDWADTI